jgi:hypothetical protein
MSIYRLNGNANRFSSGHHLLEEARNDPFVAAILPRFEEINARFQEGRRGFYLCRATFQDNIESLINRHPKHRSNKTKDIMTYVGMGFHTDEDIIAVNIFALASIIDDYKLNNDFASLDADTQMIAKDPSKFFEIVFNEGKKHIQDQIDLTNDNIRKISAQFAERETKKIVGLETEINNTRPKVTTDCIADQKLLDESEDKLDSHKETTPEVIELKEEIKKIYIRLTDHAILSKLVDELTEEKKMQIGCQEALQVAQRRLDTHKTHFEIFVQSF